MSWKPVPITVVDGMQRGPDGQPIGGRFAAFAARLIEGGTLADTPGVLANDRVAQLADGSLLITALDVAPYILAPNGDIRPILVTEP